MEENLAPGVGLSGPERRVALRAIRTLKDVLLGRATPREYNAKRRRAAEREANELSLDYEDPAVPDEGCISPEEANEQLRCLLED